MTKQELRNQFLDNRLKLGASERQLHSRKIKDNLLRNFNFTAGQTVHIFIAIEKFNETDTWPIIENFWSIGVLTATSVIDINTGDYVHTYFDQHSDFIENEWGVKQPGEIKPAEPNRIDIIFVPLLVADLNGHRLGYGKGYYDRFLSEFSSSTLRIGLTQFEPIEMIPDIQPHDQKIHYCVTPKNVFHFKD